MSGDAVSDVLRAVRLTGAVFFKIEGSDPWAAEALPSQEIGPTLLPGAEHVIEYHLVVSGACWGGVVGEPPVHLTAGDVIAFPRGDAHVISSAPGMRARPDYSAFAGARRFPVAVSCQGGGPERVELVCGFLGCDARPFNPLLATLPRVLHLPRGASGGRVEQLMQIALAEAEHPGSGSEAVLARMSELLFVELVRRYLATLPGEAVGWFAALRDEGVGRALAALHHRPAQAWDLDGLAREVGVSRSVLAERFVGLLGIPPMQYLARWRMQLAANLLGSTSMGLAEIADRVGYGSEAALSRAYKRLVGVAPADWRRGKRPSLTP
ncbi:MAG: AraC family transcriptional regulator [Anaeromyxobacteraceae bacterium]